MNRWWKLLIASGLAAGCAPSDVEVNDNLPRAPDGVAVEAPPAGEGGGSAPGAMPGMMPGNLPANYPGLDDFNKKNDEAKADDKEATPVEGQPEEPKAEPDAPADPAPPTDEPKPEPDAPAEPEAEPAPPPAPNR